MRCGKLLLLIAACSLASNAQIALTGKVIDAITSAPIQPATVILTTCTVRPDDFPRDTMVNAQGQFIFEHLPAGCYQIAAGGGNYALQEYGSRGPESFGKRILLSESANLILKLIPSGSISGSITDEKQRIAHDRAGQRDLEHDQRGGGAVAAEGGEDGDEVHGVLSAT